VERSRKCTENNVLNTKTSSASVGFAPLTRTVRRRRHAAAAAGYNGPARRCAAWRRLL